MSNKLFKTRFYQTATIALLLTTFYGCQRKEVSQPESSLSPLSSGVARPLVELELPLNDPTVTYSLNGSEYSHQDLAKPINLAEGDYRIDVRREGALLFSYPFAVTTSERLRVRVPDKTHDAANMIIASGGTVMINSDNKGYSEENKAELPQNYLHITGVGFYGNNRLVPEHLAIFKDALPTRLDLSYSSVNDEALLQISDFSRLHTLAIKGTTLSASTLARIASHKPPLIGLLMSDQEVPPDFFQVFETAPLSPHGIVDVPGTSFGDEDVDFIRHGNFWSCDLSRTAITDNGLAKLAGTNFVSLSLAETSITDEGVAHCLKFGKLENLNLEGTRVARDTINQLTSKFPNIKIQWTENIDWEIARLEKQLAEQPAGQVNVWIHNGLRHYYGATDEAKALSQVEIILRHEQVGSPMSEYMQLILSKQAEEPAVAIEHLTSWAERYSDLPNLSAACYLWCGKLSKDPERRKLFLNRATEVQGADERYRLAASELMRELLDEAKKPIGFRQEHPVKQRVKPSVGMEKRPGPWNDPNDLTVWPNSVSNANSDSWLVENHDNIRVMRPRLLLINFSNEHTTEHIARLSRQLIDTLGESSRYHGYRDRSSPRFLEYQIFKYVDLRDTTSQVGNSSKIPVKDRNAKSGFNMQYSSFFSEEFAAHYGVASPDDPSKFLTLKELLDLGYVHEVWFFESGNTQSGVHVGAFEVVEQKPQYDEASTKVAERWVQAGNGGDSEQPWVGRSCRIGCINASRGIGCFLESLAHGLEGMSNSNAIPYFTKYFREYADFNLNERYQLPFDSLYAVEYGEETINYPNAQTMIVVHQDQQYTVDNYVAAGGSAHFPPNARRHYDLDNPNPVMSTIEDWRIGSGVDGKDVAKAFTNQAFRGYKDIAPDCMGAWLVYWRQNMPGLENRQKDDDGRPMKNWLPFLFY